MYAPVPTTDFVQTKVYIAAEEKMLDSTVALMSLIGPAGSGKSTLANQLCCRMWPWEVEPDDTNFMFRLFNCATLEDFYNDLVHFYQDIDQAQERLSGNYPKTWNILQTLFRDMNKHFPNHVKLFILDDVEPTEEVLKLLNLICQMIRMNPTLDSRWKILLTSQREPLDVDVYVDIGGDNFFNMEGFDKEEVKVLFEDGGHSLTDSDVSEIIAGLGQRPLILKICMRSLKENKVDNVSECIQNLLADIATQVSALDQSDRDNPLTSALVGVKISIERLLNKLPHKEKSLQVIKMLTLLNEKNITMELLLACAETCIESPQQAAMMIRELLDCFIKRGVCTKRTELNVKVPLYRLHQLVKLSMMLLVKEEEKIALIEYALVALTLVMPKDGRMHQTRLVGFYGDHGKSLDRAIRDTRGHTPFILLLHCSMLTSMGYCHLAQRTSAYDKGVELLEEALNQFCHLVLDSALEKEASRSQRMEDPALVAVHLAKRLFEASRNLSLLESQSYQTYIADISVYHRLTKKDLGNMVDDPSTVDLVNDHLSRYDLDMFERNGKVVNRYLLAKVYVAEVLAQIYSVWSTIYRRRADYDDTTIHKCIRRGEAAVMIYNKIFDEYNVYLLAGLITERDMLSAKIQAVEEANEVKQTLSQLEVLSKIGQNPMKKYAYEAGLMRSDLSRDSYHELLCKQSIINGNGRLYEITKNEVCYERGITLFNDVLAIANSQIHGHSALSYSHKNFADFLYTCKKHGEAVVSILRAMSELHRSVRNGDSSPGHPELSHPRFKSLYSCLEKYYKKYSEERQNAMTMRGETSVRDEEKLLEADMEECMYLTNAMKWRHSDRLPSTLETVTLTASQPTDSNNDLLYLEILMETEIQAVKVVAPQS